MVDVMKLIALGLMMARRPRNQRFEEDSITDWNWIFAPREEKKDKQPDEKKSLLTVYNRTYNC